MTGQASYPDGARCLLVIQDGKVTDALIDDRDRAAPDEHELAATLYRTHERWRRWHYPEVAHRPKWRFLAPEYREPYERAARMLGAYDET